MAVITPQTDVYLLQVPLEINDINQLTFANSTAQYNYFKSLPKKAVDNFTYQRKDGTIRYGANFDSIIRYNYVMYRNDAYSNKWFYAFITDMEYLNDNVTAISIKTDVWQTWQFDLDFKKTFVEREHVNDDTVGKNTVPENMELGEYIINGNVINSDLNTAGTETNVTWICFQVSDYPSGDGALSPGFGDDVNGRLNGGVYSGLTYLMVLTPTMANRLIRCYDLAGKSDAIVAIFQVPYTAINTEHISITNQTNTIAGTITIATYTDDSLDPINLDNITVTKPTSVNSYTPRNKKLLTYPYTYFYATNNAGASATYHWEDFSSNPTFKIDGVVTQGMSIKAYPTNYKEKTGITGYEYGLTCGKIPICAWNSDYYTNWITQNAVNMPLNLATGLIGSGLNVIGSISSGGTYGVLGALTGGVSMVKTIGDAIARDYEASIVPDQARGDVNCGDINIAEKRFGFTFYPMSIKAEYARICDEFFDMFGYKVNRVKVPNLTGRRNWNYVKTIGCYIEGDIPQDDLQEIKTMFDKGITLWHNTSTFADYSQTNDII